MILSYRLSMINCRHILLMRNQFIRSLLQRQKSNDDIFLLVGDLGFSLIEPFAEMFPDRFLNVGIAEQNMISISAGLASQGFKVFNYSIGNFNTFRAAEQLRNDVDYHNLDVTTVSVGGGCAYGYLGYSHHALQDYALLRSLPNMNIYAPSDAHTCELCMHSIFNSNSPNYLRLHKANEPLLSYSALNNDQHCLVIQSQESTCLHLATGYIGNYLAHNKLIPSNEDFTLMYLWGNQHRRMCFEIISKYSVIHAYEDHLLSGGFTSWILEVLSQHSCYDIKVIPHTYKDDLIGASVSEEYALLNFTT